MLEVPLAKDISFTSVDELLASVLTDRLEHSVACDAATFHHGHERLVDEMREKVENALALDAFAGADDFGRLEAPSSDKNGEPPKEKALAIKEEVVAPVDHGAQRLLAGEDGSAAAGEETESVVESFGHLRDRQDPDAG